MGSLIVGTVVGLLSAAATLLLEAPVWAAFISYSLGGALGTLAAAMGVVLLRKGSHTAAERNRHHAPANAIPAE